ncbi:MAG: DUF2911 domain-containing protein [Verrucomicrobia bacterium]|nr:DUF2911 domain-containing protein [Cytophagales bacterium]
MKITLKSALFFSLCTAILLATNTVSAQKASPAAKVTQVANGKNITVNYSRPSVKGRKIWGELVPYGEVWRTGANEATTFEVDKDVKIEGKSLPKGKYALFTIPTENEWTIVFSKNAGQFGAFSYDEKEDALRVKVSPKTAAASTEQFTIAIAKTGVVSLLWDKLQVDFKVD